MAGNSAADGDASREIAPWLFERMAQTESSVALVWNNERTTYGALARRVHDWERELTELRIGAGAVVAIEGSFSPTAVSLLLALIRRRAIAVPLTVATRPQRDIHESVAEIQATFTIDDADQWTVAKHERTVANPLTSRLIARDNPGLVIFSSGSSGAPKAVLHDAAALLNKFRAPGTAKSTLTFLLFDHIGGMDTLFNALANGGTLVTVPVRDPDTVCRAIADHHVHTLPASPTFLNLLLISGAWRDHDLSSLKTIAYGTESMPAATLARLQEAFPGIRLAQTYGLSELGVLRTKSKESGSLWVKFTGEGYETSIRDGILWVRTAAAMMGYLNAPDLFDDEGWLNTEDAVEVDGDYLRILGRVSDLVNVGGRKIYPAEVENVIMQMENVRDVAVTGEPSALTGQLLVARVNLVEPEAFDAFKKRLRVFCRERLPAYKIPAKIELTDADQFGARMKKMRRAGALDADAGK
ncbi:MAG TPA: long-chain fatty acid--CoA ligase [Gemmatimonadaceae bacterium]